MTKIQELEDKLAALATEVRRLGDIEAVRAVRDEYWHYASKRQYDRMTDLFADDAYLDMGRPGLQAQGKQAIVKFYEMVRNSIPTPPSFPRGFNHTIKITGDNTAHAIWQADCPMIDAENKKVLHVGTVYDEEYVRIDGAWKISKLIIIPTVSEMTQLTEAPTID